MLAYLTNTFIIFFKLKSGKAYSTDISYNRFFVLYSVNMKKIRHHKDLI